MKLIRILGGRNLYCQVVSCYCDENSLSAFEEVCGVYLATEARQCRPRVSVLSYYLNPPSCFSCSVLSIVDPLMDLYVK